MERHTALKIAETVALALSPGCERMEIAGSLRRGSPDVHDIELICVPKVRPVRAPGALFPVVCKAVLGLSDQLAHAPGFGRGKWGEKFRQIIYRPGEPQQITIDLFVVEADSWGPQFAIRTGPAEFSKLLVSWAMQPGHCMKDGAIREIKSGRVLPFREEAAFFEWLGVPCWAPTERSAFRLTQYLDVHALERRA